VFNNGFGESSLTIPTLFNIRRGRQRPLLDKRHYKALLEPSGQPAMFATPQKIATFLRSGSAFA
jgi:hypothetical protein